MPKATWLRVGVGVRVGELGVRGGVGVGVGLRVRVKVDGEWWVVRLIVNGEG
jgi:hypothetical protein